MRAAFSTVLLVVYYIHPPAPHSHPSISALPLLPMSSPGGSVDDGAAAAAVCCMCGDHGMPQELFKCRLCRLRMQHRYCSELYPRAATYRQCNWCLREDGGGGSPARQTAAAAKKRTLTWSEADDSDENKRSRSSTSGGCSRSAFCTEPDKPVKKPPKARHERAVLPMREMETPAKDRKLRAAAEPEKGRFRVKVRRYKLLAEVISC
uniref:Uncharacterized protein n=1 Tax=Avena sativa TaxID=4498 RepID=A0ACD6AL23_AVESA